MSLWHEEEVFRIEPPWDLAYLDFLDKAGRRLFLVESRGIAQRAVVDGVAQHVVGEIAVNGGVVINLPTGRYAYVATAEVGMCVVDNGSPSPWYREVPTEVGVRISSDGKRLAYGADSGQDRYRHVNLVLDNRTFDETNLEPMPVQFSPDGRQAAWVEQVGHQVRVVCDGVSGPLFDSIKTFEATAFPDSSEYQHPRTLFFSPPGDRLLYIGVRDGSNHVVVDNQPSDPIDCFALSLPAWSPDGQHYALGITRSERHRLHRVLFDSLLIDGVRQAEWDPNALIQGPLYDPQGRLVIVSPITDKYHLERDGEMDGIPRATHDAIPTDLQLLEDGTACVTETSRDGQVRLVIGGAEGHWFDGLYPFSARLSSDNRRFGYLAHQGSDPWLVVDGDAIAAVDDHWWTRRSGFSPDSQHVAYSAVDPAGEGYRPAIDGETGPLAAGWAGPFYDSNTVAFVGFRYLQDSGKTQIVRATCTYGSAP